MKTKPVIAVTTGDPCGIGPEIVLKALSKNLPSLSRICTPVMLAEISVLEQTAATLDFSPAFARFSNQNTEIKSEGTLWYYPVEVPHFKIRWGEICAEGGQHAYTCITTAIRHVSEGSMNAIATAPIHKKSLQMARIPYLDHTEIFTKMTHSTQTMTLFVTGNLRIFFHTRHMPLRQVADSLGTDHLVLNASNCIKYLKQIGIPNPRIAIAALNPHAGDHGLFGREEIDIIEPAVARARADGMDVDGPIPADSVFQLAKEGIYDGILSLYHDQGHIAAKTYDFYKTISLTMGLPFLRTSVDHGTAFNIAGQNKANEQSMLEAIKAAAKYYW